MRKLVAVSAGLLALVFSIAGFVSGTIVEERRVYATHSSSDSFLLPPSSQRFITKDITELETKLTVHVSTNTTLKVEILYEDKPFFLPWNVQEGTRVYFIPYIGPWDIRITNDDPDNPSSSTYTITVKELYKTSAKPYAWLRTPLFSLAALSTAATVPIYFYDDLRKRVDRKTVETLLTVILLAAVVFNHRIAGLVLGTKAPMVVAGGVSMEPTVQEGDLVVLRGAGPGGLGDDDIILFHRIVPELDEEGHDISKPILHRIVDVVEVGGRVYYQTKGDNSQLDDWLVPHEGVLGKTVLIFPGVGYVLLLLERIEAKLFIIITIAFAFFILPKIRTLEKWNEIIGIKDVLRAWGRS